MAHSTRRRFAGAFALGAVFSALLLPTSAAASELAAPDQQIEFFYRFEQVATGNWTTVEDCGDGTQSETLVSVVGGLEFETPDLEVNEVLTVRILNFETCEGDFINEFGAGPADYDGRLSLKRARVNGTVTLRNGDEATVEVHWRGTSPIDKTVNRTKFPGFRGVFTSRERYAVAMGSVVVSGASLISGRSESGSIETLEDKNITFGADG